MITRRSCLSCHTTAHIMTYASEVMALLFDKEIVSIFMKLIEKASSKNYISVWVYAMHDLYFLSSTKSLSGPFFPLEDRQFIFNSSSSNNYIAFLDVKHTSLC